MWISRKRLNRIYDRLERLEDTVRTLEACEQRLVISHTGTQVFSMRVHKGHITLLDVVNLLLKTSKLELRYKEAKPENVVATLKTETSQEQISL